MYYIGFDIGSSSVKLALVDALSGKKIIALHEPQEEMAITALQSDWAEQDPNSWWLYVCKATKIVVKEVNLSAKEISGIAISYQMHGLVVVEKSGVPLRDSILLTLELY